MARNRYCYILVERGDVVSDFRLCFVCVQRSVIRGNAYGYFIDKGPVNGDGLVHMCKRKFESAEAAQKALDKLAIRNNWRNAELEW